ncbi:MAG TPA: ABC transporter ATP-binding protein [Hyphomicrobiaceae bacterium]|nr:ABC transporter ATP-binding protein [Hyphomicrobiaceae bacterium]
MLLDARNVTKAFGSFKAVDDASIAVSEGEVLGLIGPNGAGKSTFFNCLTGDLYPTSGSVHFEGRDVTRLAPEERARLGIARTFQVPLTFQSMSVLDNVMIGAFLRYHNAAAARDKARAVIADIGLGHVADAPARSLGTPGRKRLEIARALASEPRVLLLDEAMAGLTPAEIRTAIDLVRQIHGAGTTLVIVEHIMEVIVSLADRVVVFHQGREIARGTPQEVTRDAHVIEAYLGKRHAAKLSGSAP